MSQIILNIPDDALLDLRLSPEAFGQELCTAAAVKLFELGRLSSGAAARLADMPRSVFLSKLVEYGVNTFDLDQDDLGQETRLG